jgi:hypothetical protein
MISKPEIEALRTEYVRAQAQFAGVIQELEADLKRMKDNERVPHEVVLKKDLQIESLIQFNNRIDDLFQVYKLATINYHYELLFTNDMLWRALKSNDTAFEVLMKELVPKTTPRPNVANG